jgi:hypothetical protein
LEEALVLDVIVEVWVLEEDVDLAEDVIVLEQYEKNYDVYETKFFLR